MLQTRVIYFFLLGLAVSSSVLGEEVLLDRQQFLEQAFSVQGLEPELKSLWVNQELKREILEKISYETRGLRVRYWLAGQRSAWILEEIGKERPITIGVVVDNHQIVDLSVLVYRETRGGEIRQAFFTRQFEGSGLKRKPRGLYLDKSIDGITGATLSVRAAKKIATLALFLHRQVIPQLNGPQEKL